jgi:chorismate mutase
MPVRGIRGATTSTANTAEAITEATDELLRELVKANTLDEAEICFAFFTTTQDLNAEFPAYAARRMGWIEVPLLCGHDMNVTLPNPRGVPMCIRILLLYNTDRQQSDMRFVYLRGAKAIKADLDSLRASIT